MFRVLAAVLFCLLALSSAAAFPPNQESLLIGEIVPAVYTDFTQLSALPPALYGFTGGTVGSSTCINSSGVVVIQTGPCFDHTSSGTPLGLRTWHGVTNLYLHSNAPATQTVTVANATQYTISFWGTGTLTLAGACTQVMTGVAGTLTSYTCTSATTALVMTDGSLTATAYPQVETSPYAGPRCVTGAAPVLCTADLPTLAGQALAIATASSGAVVVEANTPHNSANFVTLANAAYAMFISNNGGVNSNQDFAVNNSAVKPLGSGNWFTAARVGYSWAGTTSLSSGNGSNPTSQTYGKPSAPVYLGSNGSATFLDGYIRKDAFFVNPFPASGLQRITPPTYNLQ